MPCMALLGYLIIMMTRALVVYLIVLLNNKIGAILLLLVTNPIPGNISAVDAWIWYANEKLQMSWRCLQFPNQILTLDTASILERNSMVVAFISVSMNLAALVQRDPMPLLPRPLLRASPPLCATASRMYPLHPLASENLKSWLGQT